MSSSTALLHCACDVGLARAVLTAIEREALLAVAFKLLLEVVDGREVLALHELAVRRARGEARVVRVLIRAVVPQDVVRASSAITVLTRDLDQFESPLDV